MALCPFKKIIEEKNGYQRTPGCGYPDSKTIVESFGECDGQKCPAFVKNAIYGDSCKLVESAVKAI